MNQKIIQNAVLIKETGEILKSTYRHDYIERTLPDGTSISIDGGLNYLHYTTANDEYCISLVLYEDSSTEELKNKLVWQTFGIDGKDNPKYVLLKDCGSEHLKNILKTLSSIPISIQTPNSNQMYFNVVESILHDRV